MRWFWWQRVSAMLLAPMIVVHLATILYAVRDGLSATEVLERTQGNMGWAVFYVAFVVAASVHAPIGLYNVISEWSGWRGPGLAWAVGAFALVLALTGLRGVWAIL